MGIVDHFGWYRGYPLTRNPEAHFSDRREKEQPLSGHITPCKYDRANKRIHIERSLDLETWVQSYAYTIRVSMVINSLYLLDPLYRIYFSSFDYTLTVTSSVVLEKYENAASAELYFFSLKTVSEVHQCNFFFIASTKFHWYFGLRNFY